MARMGNNKIRIASEVEFALLHNPQLPRELKWKDGKLLYVYFPLIPHQFFFFLIHDRHRERQRHRRREKQAPCWEPDVGLDPGDSRITPWAKGRGQTAAPPSDPDKNILDIGVLKKFTIYIPPPQEVH